MSKKPNVILILNDDMGYSDLGCYGGEIDSKNLNQLAENGLRFTQFYNTARCSPSRASLLTGLHPHQTGIGILVNDHGPEGYAGTINNRCVTIAEVLKEHGYGTYMSGKWHISHEKNMPDGSWPHQRGFDQHYGIIHGASSYFYPSTLVRNGENVEEEAREDPGYYITDAISDHAVSFINKHIEDKKEQPFFLYVAYTAPHWPLHSKPEDIEKYKGKFDAGWDQLREARLQRMIEMGIINEGWGLTDRDPSQPAWDKVKNKEWDAHRMAVYAAQVDCMDQGIGRIIQCLEDRGIFDDTLIIFLADNGGCAEGIIGKGKFDYVRRGSGREKTRSGEDVKYGNTPNIIAGPEHTYQSYGKAWANLSNTPFRMYKHWTHEGGIATPFIVHWPAGINVKGEIRHQQAQLPDVMATILEITDANYPATHKGHDILALEGKSMVPAFENEETGKKMLFFEHEGNGAVRDGKWKLVRDFPFDWELYNMENDRIEMKNLVKTHPERARAMIDAYEQWAGRVGVVPFNKILNIELKKVPPPFRQIARWFANKYVFSSRKWQKLIEKYSEDQGN